ncbi:MAG TPA: PqqD family protein [Candidatus Acidoferrales bacterium]|nr:PqqD family protein [Candidatus Acidoferrales bacterium]
MSSETITLNPQLAWREIEGRVVVISPADSVVHELNETATFIWKQAESGRSVAEIADLLSLEFCVEPTQARSDTEELLRMLLQKGLVTS